MLALLLAEAVNVVEIVFQEPEFLEELGPAARGLEALLHCRRDHAVGGHAALELVPELRPHGRGAVVHRGHDVTEIPQGPVRGRARPLQGPC